MSIEDELLWQAFRFIANEMTPEEVREFEQRLENDAAACAAVAQSVQLTHALVAASDVLEPAAVSNTVAHTAAHTVPRRHWRRLGWAGAATAVALLAVSAAFLIGRQYPSTQNDTASHPRIETPKRNDVGPKQPKPNRSTVENAAGDGLVTAWLDLRNTLVSQDNTAENPELSAGDEVNPIAAELLDDKEGEFDWMIAAVDAEMPSGMSEDRGMKEKKN